MTIKVSRYSSKHIDFVLDEDKTAISAIHGTFGYVIFLDGVLHYASGNCSSESTTVVEKNSDHSITPEGIKQLAICTAEEMANYPDLHDLEFPNPNAVSVVAIPMKNAPGIYSLREFLKTSVAEERELIEAAIWLLGESSGALHLGQEKAEIPAACTNMVPYETRRNYK